MKSSSPRTAILLVAAVSLTCGGDSATGPDARVIDFDRAAMLANLRANVILPTVEQVATDAAALATAVQDSCDALGTGDADSARAAAQDAWRAAASSWQRAEVMQLGPTADGRRDLIYSWPIVSACAVDQDVVLLRDDPNGYDISARLTNRRGLDALEYALFAPGLETVCPPQAAPAGWDALSADERRAARCAWAEVAALDLSAQADELAAAWRDPASLTGDDPTAAFHALFYIDTETKDQKLAVPAGLVDGPCGAAGTVCPAAVESPHANQSLANVAGNLSGFRALFTGGDDLGFDDFLLAAGADSVAATMVDDLDAALALIDAIDATLVDTLASDPAAVVELHGAVRAVTTPLKQEVPSTLGLTIPDEAGGDTD